MAALYSTPAGPAVPHSVYVRHPTTLKHLSEANFVLVRRNAVCHRLPLCLLPPPQAPTSRPSVTSSSQAARLLYHSYPASSCRSHSGSLIPSAVLSTSPRTPTPIPRWTHPCPTSVHRPARRIPKISLCMRTVPLPMRSPRFSLSRPPTL